MIRVTQEKWTDVWSVRFLFVHLQTQNNKLIKTSQKRKSYEKNSSVADGAGGDDGQCTVQIRGMVAR